MIYLEFLSMLCLGTALFGAVAEGRALWLKLRAQQRFFLLLSTEDATRDLRQLRGRLSHDGVMTRVELQEVTHSLERWAEKLSPRDRRFIEQGLYQDSLRGRARYAAQWMDRVGIEVGRLATAIR